MMRVEGERGAFRRALVIKGYQLMGSLLTSVTGGFVISARWCSAARRGNLRADRVMEVGFFEVGYGPSIWSVGLE